MTNDLTLSTELYSGMITLASQMKVIKMNSVEIRPHSHWKAGTWHLQCCLHFLNTNMFRSPELPMERLGFLATQLRK